MIFSLQKKRLVLACICSVLMVSTLPLVSAFAKPAHKLVKYHLYLTHMGSTGYAMGVALMRVINKHHPWLRIDVMETTGTFDAINAVMDDPKLRKTVFVDAYTGKMLDIIKGNKPLKHATPDLLWLAGWTRGTGHWWIAKDPKIKTAQDLVGKRVSIGTPAAHGDLPKIMFEAIGVLDKMKPVRLSLSAGRDAVKDSKIDVALSTWSGVPGGTVPSSSALELLRFGCHPVLLTKKEVEAPCKVYPGLAPFKLNPIVGFENLPTGYAYSGAKGWTAYPEFPEEIAYEIVKTAAEHSKEFVAYTALAKGLTPDVFSQLPFDEKYFHPGALRYYKEKGFKLGSPTD